MEGEEVVYCLCCLSLGEHQDMPGHLKVLRKGRFGFFKKGGRERRRLVTHTKNPVHIWCLSKYKKEKEIKKDFKAKNERACKIIVTKAVHILKDAAGSAIDFIKSNNKDQLLLGTEYPLKNDGKQHYFELRTVFHEKLRKKIKQMMLSVSRISATLDKVTVSGVPYTVICTYYFWKGELNVFMNELSIMKSEFSDGEGCAKMLCQSLMKTLGLNKEELAGKLEHLSFDGVYATGSEEEGV